MSTDILQSSRIESAVDTLLQRLEVDRDLLMKLALSENLTQDLSALGFDVPSTFAIHLESSCRKIRTYITDQIHVLEMKRNVNESGRFPESGNGPYW
jgi:hypothetical protein